MSDMRADSTDPNDAQAPAEERRSQPLSRAYPTIVEVTGEGWASADRRTGGGERILTNARIVAGAAMVRGTVHVVGDRIASIDAGNSASPAAVDLQGDFLIPGLVDIHTDNLERHLEPRPRVEWPGLPALLTHDRQMAAAGVTTVFDALCIGDRHRGCARPRDALLDALHAMQRAQRDGLLKAEHLLHLRCEVSTDAVVDTFAALVRDPFVRLVSLMDHTPGERQWHDLERWRTANRLPVGDEELLGDLRTAPWLSGRAQDRRTRSRWRASPGITGCRSPVMTTRRRIRSPRRRRWASRSASSRRRKPQRSRRGKPGCGW